MAITISGANNVDKILATDGVLDSISGFNVVGVMTAGTFDVTGKTTTGHLNIGSNIQLGNAGVVTATTFTGNLTGNVNATSNLLLQIGGSEKFRVASSGQLGIGGANYGSAGQVLTSGGSGSAATWSTIASDKITEGNTEAEVVDTGSDGHFKVTTEGSERLRVDSSGKIGIKNTSPSSQYFNNLVVGDNSSGDWGITIRTSSSNKGVLAFSDTDSADANRYDGYIAYQHNDQSMRFNTGGANERLRIMANGDFGLNDTSPTANASGNDTVLSIKGKGSSYSGKIDFKDSSGNIDNHIASDNAIFMFNCDPNSQNGNTAMLFSVHGSERFRFGRHGQLGIAGANYGSSGQVLTSGGSGSAATWSTVSGTTINNNANNRVITGSGTANTLEGESQFTYDGTSVKNLFSVTGSTPTTAEFRNTASTWGGGVRFKSNNTYGTVEIINYDGSASGSFYNSTGGWHWSGNMQFHGSVLPWTNGDLNLGSSSKRWNNIYTTDLQLSNESKKDEGGNDVDGTWGDWTLQEGESDVYMINNRSGKKFKIKMEEVE